MECGQRLLGFLELGGAVLFTTGLAVQAAVQKLASQPQNRTKAIVGSKVLILGGNKQFGRELVRQFIHKECKVAHAGTQNFHYDNCAFFKYNSLEPKKLQELARQIESDFGEIDILVYANDPSPGLHKEPIDAIVEAVENSFVDQFNIVAKFIPNLAKRSGRFVTIEPQRSTSGFSMTYSAISTLSDSLIQQMATPNSGLKVTRALRRNQRCSDQENVEDSVNAILNAVEAGRCSVTLPTAKQHIKNILRHIMNELCQMWNDTIMRQHKLTA